MRNTGLRNLEDLLFDTWRPGSRQASTLFSGLFLVFLFVGGLFHWAYFLNFGESGFAFDWGEQFHYYEVLHQSITNLDIPYLVPNGFYFSDRFMGNLQAPFSPHMLLLPLMGLGKFIVFNALLMYSLGFAGCLLIKQRYQLSAVPFTIFFLLFNFNGHITAHISVGHPWFGYFLLPFFVLLVLELARPNRTDKLGPSILLSFVLLGILLQGSFHIFFWCLGFLALLGLFNRQLWRVAAFAILSGIGLTLFRFLPAMFFYGGHQPSYASGYPTFSVFIDALTTIKSFTFVHPTSALYDVGWWEHDIFIGYVGVGFIAIFGIYRHFRNNSNINDFRFTALDLPVLLFILFSFGIVFDLISDLQIPFLSWAERVPSRFLIIPLIFLTIFAAIRMQEYLPQIRSSAALKLMTLAAVVQLAHSLAAHSFFWRISSGGNPVGDYGVNDFIAPAQQDGLYTASVLIGAILSIMALVALCALYYRKVLQANR